MSINALPLLSLSVRDACLLLSLPRSFCPFALIFAPPTIPVFVYFWPATNGRLRSYLPSPFAFNSLCRYLCAWFAPGFVPKQCPRAVCVYLCRATSTWLYCPAISACLSQSLPYLFCPFASISTPPPLILHQSLPWKSCPLYLSLSRQQCQFASRSHANPTHFRLFLLHQKSDYAHLCPATSSRLCLYLPPPQQCSFAFISLLRQLSSFVSTTHQLCTCVRISDLLPLLVYTYLWPSKKTRFGLSLLGHHFRFASLSDPSTMPICIYLFLPDSARLHLRFVTFTWLRLLIPHQFCQFASIYPPPRMSYCNDSPSPLPFCVNLYPTTSIRLHNLSCVVQF